jgi:hypothetical protein
MTGTTMIAAAASLQPDAAGQRHRVASRRVRTPWIGSNGSLACLVVAAMAGALAGPVATSVRNEGLAGAALDLLGVSAATWLAAGIGLAALRRGASIAVPMLPAAYAMALVGLLPSANLSWLALAALLCLLLLRGGHDAPTRTGLVILTVLALREPLASLALSLLAAPLVSLDAAMVARLLELAGTQSTRTGNIVENAEGLKLIVLTGCASFSNLSLALLAWFAVVRGAGMPLRARQRAAGIVLAVLLVFVNIARLAAMSLSPQAYAWIHDGMGAEVFLAAQIALVAVACLAARRI